MNKEKCVEFHLKRLPKPEKNFKLHVNSLFVFYLKEKHGISYKMTFYNDVRLQLKCIHSHFTVIACSKCQLCNNNHSCHIHGPPFLICEKNTDKNNTKNAKSEFTNKETKKRRSEPHKMKTSETESQLNQNEK